MAFAETKVYFDGSHYIAIPHTTRPKKKDYIKQVMEKSIVEEGIEEPIEVQQSLILSYGDSIEKVENTTKTDENIQNTTKNDKILSNKDIFEKLYMLYISDNKKVRKDKIIENMRQYFDSDNACIKFVDMNFERKQRNLIARRIRMCRKANLAGFNYFCTFTYDSSKHTEDSFKKKLRTAFRHMVERKGWKYLGVWERAPETNRLHFHGLFNIPPNGMPGEIVEKRDFDKRAIKMRTTFQSSYFNERFGRSDFEMLDANEQRLGSALAYLMKYLEKTGEKIVYSKGLPQYFISDIVDEDVVCRIGQEDKKLLLFDDFKCFDEGCYMGQVSPQVISELRKVN